MYTVAMKLAILTTVLLGAIASSSSAAPFEPEDRTLWQSPPAYVFKLAADSRAALPADVCPTTRFPGLAAYNRRGEHLDDYTRLGDTQWVANGRRGHVRVVWDRDARTAFARRPTRLYIWCAWEG